MNSFNKSKFLFYGGWVSVDLNLTSRVFSGYSGFLPPQNRLPSNPSICDAVLRGHTGVVFRGRAPSRQHSSFCPTSLSCAPRISVYDCERGRFASQILKHTIQRYLAWQTLFWLKKSRNHRFTPRNQKTKQKKNKQNKKISLPWAIWFDWHNQKCALISMLLHLAVDRKTLFKNIVWKYVAYDYFTTKLVHVPKKMIIKKHL